MGTAAHGRGRRHRPPCSGLPRSGHGDGVVDPGSEALTDAVIAGQRLGLVDPTVSRRALVTFIHADAIGMIANDLDAGSAPPEDLTPVIARALGAFQIDRRS